MGVCFGDIEQVICSFSSSIVVIAIVCSSYIIIVMYLQIVYKAGWNGKYCFAIHHLLSQADLSSDNDNGYSAVCIFWNSHYDYLIFSVYCIVSLYSDFIVIVLLYNNQFDLRSAVKVFSVSRIYCSCLISSNRQD